MIFLFLFPLWLWAQEKYPVEVDWDPVSGALGYEVCLSAGEELKKDCPEAVQMVETNSYRGDMRAGVFYVFIRAKLSTSTFGDWKKLKTVRVGSPFPELLYPPHQMKFKVTKKEEMSLTLRWRSEGEGVSYRVLIRDEKSDWKMSQVVESSSLSVQVPAGGVFKWQVLSLDVFSDASVEEAPAFHFRVVGKRLARPVIEEPKGRIIRKLLWSKPPGAEWFAVILQRKVGKKYRQMDKITRFESTEYDFNLSQPSGEYRLLLQAGASHRSPSPVAKLEFSVLGGLDSESAIESAEKNEALEKPSSYYGIASYLITEIKYQLREYDILERSSQFAAVGGTGRLGLGYQNYAERLGYFAIVDLSGFTIEGENHTFAAAELHLVWRLYHFAHQWRLSTGLGYKELPQVIGSAASGLRDLGKHTAYSVHGGVEFWYPLSKKLGVQGNGRLYYNFAGEAPDGGDFKSSLTYQAGAMGSLRLSERAVGLMGWAYRMDKANYGKKNEIQLEGNYLNWILEYSF